MWEQRYILGALVPWSVLTGFSPLPSVSLKLEPTRWLHNFARLWIHFLDLEIFIFVSDWCSWGRSQPTDAFPSRADQRSRPDYQVSTQYLLTLYLKASKLHLVRRIHWRLGGKSYNFILGPPQKSKDFFMANNWNAINLWIEPTQISLAQADI